MLYHFFMKYTCFWRCDSALKISPIPHAGSIGGIGLSESSFGSTVKTVSDSVKNSIRFTNPKPVLDSMKPVPWRHRFCLSARLFNSTLHVNLKLVTRWIWIRIRQSYGSNVLVVWRCRSDTARKSETPRFHCHQQSTADYQSTCVSTSLDIRL